MISSEMILGEWYGWYLIGWPGPLFSYNCRALERIILRFCRVGRSLKLHFTMRAWGLVAGTRPRFTHWVALRKQAAPIKLACSLLRGTCVGLNTCATPKQRLFDRIYTRFAGRRISAQSRHFRCISSPTVVINDGQSPSEYREPLHIYTGVVT